MISGFGSGAATLRRILLMIALAALLLFTSQTTKAQSMAVGSLTQTGTGLSTFSITNNQSFQLTLMVNINFVSGGMTYFLQVSNNGSGLFQITARDVSLSPYPNGSVILLPCLLNPVCSQDLGTSNAGAATDPPGNYTMGILTIEALNVPVGQYTIGLDSRGIVTDRTGGGFVDVPITGATTVTINVIPEPNATGLAVLGGGVLLAFVVRRNERPRELRR